MAEGYRVSSDEHLWRELDEFLCEYVDGTMDPVVREVFEEYVAQTPELATHVECLCEARQVLSSSECPCHVRADFVDRLRRRLTTEAMSRSRVFPPGVYGALGYLTVFTSALAVVAVAGMMLGAAMMEEQREPVESVAAVADGSSRATRVAALSFSHVFVPPENTSLKVGAVRRMTPVLPRRMPVVPLWADAEWRTVSAAAVSAW